MSIFLLPAKTFPNFARPEIMPLISDSLIVVLMYTFYCNNNCNSNSNSNGSFHSLSFPLQPISLSNRPRASPHPHIHTMLKSRLCYCVFAVNYNDLFCRGNLTLGNGEVKEFYC